MVIVLVGGHGDCCHGQRLNVVTAACLKRPSKDKPLTGSRDGLRAGLTEPFIFLMFTGKYPPKTSRQVPVSKTCFFCNETWRFTFFLFYSSVSHPLLSARGAQAMHRMIDS